MSLLAKFAPLVNMVRKDHIEQGAVGGGHDLTHALVVAGYCERIADDPEIATLSWLAAVLHNTDRLWPKDSDEETATRIRHHLDEGTKLDERQKDIVLQAVMRHNRPNDPEDGVVTTVLKDADRLANLGLVAVIRSGQLYNSLLPADPRYIREPDPTANYRNPKTVLYDVLAALEWDPREDKPKFSIRLPKAIALATPQFDWLKMGRDLEARRLEEAGLTVHPFPEDLDLAYASAEKK